MSSQAIAIILARGGSKGIPGKNLMDFGGKPLLAWSILQAREATAISRVYVSSDDQDILAVARKFGAEPICRPLELATDTSSAEEALLHALDEIERLTASSVDLVVFLQATSPLRESDDIDKAVRQFCEQRGDSLFSAAVLEDFCIWTQREGRLQGLTFDPLNRGRRQDREPLFLENGSIYIFRSRVLRRFGNRLGGKILIFEMPYWKSFEIDTMADVEVCWYYFEKKLLSRWSKGNPDWTILSDDIDLMVYDFDGVMTDNRVLVWQDGSEGILANRADGLGVARLRALGLRQLILTTETNPVVQARAAKLNLEVIAGCHEKKLTLQDFCKQQGVDTKRVVYVGNDINDLEVMKEVGFPIAPADAHPEVLAIAWGATKAKGGAGVIKELAERMVSKGDKE